MANTDLPDRSQIDDLRVRKLAELSDQIVDLIEGKGFECYELVGILEAIKFIYLKKAQ